MKNRPSKLTLGKETLRALNPLTDEDLAQVAGGSTGEGTRSGLSPCRRYFTLHCSVAGGRGTCTL